MIANTWVAVYRGDEVNEYGDPTDLGTPVDGLERLPLALTEQSRTTFDPETSEARTIRYAIGRATAGTDIQQDDRLRDERTARWWAVRSISGGGFTFFGARDLLLDLRAV